jgi:hypothetical protein
MLNGTVGDPCIRWKTEWSILKLSQHGCEGPKLPSVAFGRLGRGRIPKIGMLLPGSTQVRILPF